MGRFWPRHCLPGTFVRRVIWTLLLVLVPVSLSLLVVDQLQPCEALGLACKERDIISRVQGINAMLCYGVFTTLIAIRSYSITFRASRLSDTSDHWTMASSQDIFLECSHVVRSSQDSALLLIGVFTTALAVLDFTSTLSSAPLNSDGSIKKGLDAQVKICGPERNSCHLSYMAMTTLAAATAGCMLYVSSSYLFLPQRAWSPVTDAAARQVGESRMLRLPLLSRLVLIEGLIVAMLGVYTRTRRRNASEPELLAFVVAYLIVLAGLLVTVIWLNALYNFSALPAGLRYVGRVLRSTLHCTAGRLLRSAAASKVQELDEGGNVVRLSSRGAGHLFECYESSLRFQQLVYVLISGLVWYRDAVGQSTTYKVCIWSFRVVAGSLLLFTRDAPATFQDLDVAAGFGLVVNARQLAVAIDAHLVGRPAPATLRTYKASMMRMQETVAVSYRWQTNRVRLSQDGSEVNMSRWQLTELLGVLRDCNCMYVWIDHLCVPQDGVYAHVQMTLLSRMMAVYASAGLTLALRSLEPENSRYHQRGWTLQEFANASSLVVLTQPRDEQGGGEGEGAAEDGLAALKGDEEELALSVRAMLQAQSAHRRPLWLFSDIESITTGMSDEQIRERDALYARLADCLNTTEPADMVRALYPLVYDRPVESEDELCRLVSSASMRMDSFVNSGGEGAAATSRRTLDLELLLAADAELLGGRSERSVLDFDVGNL